MLLFAYFNANILYSVHLLCARWSFAIGLFLNVLFQIFDYVRKHVPTMLLISMLLCWHITFYRTFKGINPVTRILLIETLYKFITIKCCFTLTHDVCFRLVLIQIFCISRLALLRFTFHWYFHCSIKNMYAV